jgi:cytochrome c oxidase subunit 4
MSPKTESISVYLFVWLALAICAAATTGIAFLDIGSFRIALELISAALMAVLVGAFLMELRQKSKIMRLALIAGMVWLTILLGLTLADYMTRTWATPH